MTPRALVRLLDEAYSGRAWHGPTLRGALRGVGWREAHRHPGVGRHSIRAIVVHAAFHDVYHAGQIQLIRRLLRQTARA